jgi:5-methylcytosine-specific restriction endonuclease McrBC GTP-binding regulatory subunit McrB
MMMKAKKERTTFDASEEQLVLASLERDQLTEVKKHHFPRRRLKGFQVFVLWALRIYLLFMMAVVIYQVWSSAH